MSEELRQLKSYVWHHDSGRCFFVSTIERESSAMVTQPPRFMETLAWEYDWEKEERGNIVAMEGEGDPCSQHFAVCLLLFLHGKYVQVGS